MDDIIDLPSLAAELLDRARESSSGRAAKQVYAVGPLRAVVIGLTEGGQLAEHNAPPAATLQCVSGNARLVAGDRSWVVTPGQLVAIPPERHSVDALSDCALLLSVAADTPPTPVEEAIAAG